MNVRYDNPNEKDLFSSGWNEWDQNICHVFLLRAAAEKTWRINSLFFPFLKLKSSELLNMCAAIKNTTSGSEWHCLSYLIPSLPCPHFIINHRKKTQVSLARFLLSQLRGLYRLSQREHAETFPPSSCLWESLQMSLCFFAAALKIADDCSIQVLFVKMFSLYLACLPQWLGLGRHSNSPRLCCVSFSLW